MMGTSSNGSRSPAGGSGSEELKRRNHQLEVENRKLQRKFARLELFEEIRKKAAGLLNLEYKGPEFDEND
jgi:hypothetical protein